jgi:hypothetical protein
VTFKKDPKEVRGHIFQFSVAMEKYLRWVMYEEEIYLRLNHLAQDSTS